MSKLARKFLISISVILLVVTLLSVYLNSNFIQRYFLYREKQDLNRITDELITDANLTEAIVRLEEENDVIIAVMNNTDDNDLLNGDLRTAFLKKGISLGGYGNFWLWDQDRKDANTEGRKLRIYQQEALHYSLMVQYVGMEKELIAIAKIIPAMTQTIGLINLVTACVFSTAALVMLLLIFLLVKRITTPLLHIGETAKAIAALDFQTVEVKTGDELELLAQDINDMSGKLKAAHQALEEKNRQMESLLANVSHDLKTPVSLIKAYSSGIKDGMDDGTFLDTIILQNEAMERMIERLLDIARQQQAVPVERLNVSALLQEAVEKYRSQANAEGLAFSCQIQSDLMLETGRSPVETIFDNMLSNAVKYASGDRIAVTLEQQSEYILFAVENETTAEISLDRLWEPFYVAEQSRNKNMSGTGLGLSIVKVAAQNNGYECDCRLTEGKICFTVIFPLSPKG